MPLRHPAHLLAKGVDRPGKGAQPGQHHNHHDEEYQDHDDDEGCEHFYPPIGPPLKMGDNSSSEKAEATRILLASMSR